MAGEFGRRRAEIIAFLKGLSERERLVALTYLSNDAAISAGVPDLARAVLGMHRSCYRRELLQLVDKGPNLDLRILARRKGCRIQRVVGPQERWRIIPSHAPLPQQAGSAHGPRQDAITPIELLEVLRSLPDEATLTTPSRCKP
jgi:hypothetical protein